MDKNNKKKTLYNLVIQYKEHGDKFYFFKNKR